MHPIVVGIETDEDTLILHGKDGQVWRVRVQKAGVLVVVGDCVDAPTCCGLQRYYHNVFASENAVTSTPFSRRL